MDEQENITQEECVENTSPNDGQANEQSQNVQSEPTSDFLRDPTVLAYIDKQVAEGVKNALKGNTPKANTTDLTEQEVKNFEKMTYKERLNLFNTNPQAYYKLSKGAN